MGNASIIIMSGSDKRLFWTILMSWSVSRCKDKMRKGWGRKNFCVSKYESYEPIWPSSPLQACLYLSAGFCLLQCKVGLWGFGSANKNTTKPPPTTQQLTSKTTHATGREKKQGTEPFFACLEKLIIALPWLWKARAMSPAQPNKLKPGGNMFLQVLILTTSALPNMQSLYPTASTQERWFAPQCVSSPLCSSTSLDTENQSTIQQEEASSWQLPAYGISLLRVPRCCILAILLVGFCTSMCWR